ncbi:MAG: carboxypeptidase-like regulatory domain-containing protein [Planctomycetota bacterium]
MKSPVLAVLVVVASLAALALGTVAVFGDSPQEPATFEPVDTAPEVASAPGEEATAIIDGESPHTAAGDGFDEPERHEVGSAPAPGSAPTTVRVRVVDGQTKAPVPHAEVFWAAVNNRAEREGLGDIPVIGRRFFGGSKHVAVGLIAKGQRRTTDDAGETILPADSWHVVVAARTQGRIGFGEYERGQGDALDVALVDDAGVAIRVVDEKGDPRPGIAVTVTQGSAPDKAAPIWTADSGSDGIARMPYFRLCVQGGLGARFLAAARVPLAIPAVKEFGAEPLPDAPIELRVPGTGRIEVTIVDRQGLPIESGMRVWTQLKRDPAALGQLPLPRMFDTIFATKARGSAIAVLEPVGLDLEFVIGARFDEGGRADRFNGPLFRGPIRDGETVKVQLTAPEWLTLLRGRMIGPKGEPWIDAQVPSQIRDVARVWHDAEIHTDHEGHFEIVTRVEGDVAPPALMEMTEGMPDGTRLVGKTPVPGFAAGQRIELGDVQIHEVPPLVSGVCVDERGVPVPGARLQVQVSVDGKRFNDGGLARGGSDDKGEFRLYGIPPVGEMRIFATAGKHLPAVVPLIATGARTEVMLMRSVDLRLRIRVPSGVPQKAVRVELRAADGSTRELDLQMQRRGDVLAFDADDLPRGVFDLAVQVRNFPGDLRVVPGLVLDPDSDPAQRRVDVDLRESLFHYQLRAVGPAGDVDPAVRGVVLARTLKADGTLDWQAFQIANGVADFVAPLRSIEAVMIPQGRAEVQAWLQPGENRLFTTPIFPCELTLPGMRALAGGATVRISLVLMAETGLPQGIRGVDQHSGGTFGLERALTGKSGGGWLGADDQVQVPVSRNGRYQVVARVQGSGRGGQQSRVIGEIDVVVDGVAPTRVSLPFDQKKFEEALNASRKRG